MSKHKPSVVTIAGSDSSGGAGIQADVKAISATGAYAASVITALTAQNTQGVHAIFPVPPDFIRQQIDAVFSDLSVKAVKIGMLHDAAAMMAVVEGLKQYHPEHVVLDPVMIAKNGCALLNLDAIDFLKEQLFPLITLITPNLFEAEKITGTCIATSEAMSIAAYELGETYQINVLIKGGHLNTAQSSDVLYDYQARSYHWFHAERINSKNTHGTGCTLSSAIASHLAQGYTLIDAITHAKHYLTQAIHTARTHHQGHGHGPVEHFWLL